MDRAAIVLSIIFATIIVAIVFAIIVSDENDQH